MYENMTVLTNKEYAELVIKAHKYDMLRSRTMEFGFTSIADEAIYEFTEEEKSAMAERRKMDEAI